MTHAITEHILSATLPGVAWVTPAYTDPDVVVPASTTVYSAEDRANFTFTDSVEGWTANQYGTPFPLISQNGALGVIPPVQGIGDGNQDVALAPSLPILGLTVGREHTLYGSIFLPAGSSLQQVYFDLRTLSSVLIDDVNISTTGTGDYDLIANEWVDFSLSFTAIESALRIEVFAYALDTSLDRSFYLDNIRIEQDGYTEEVPEVIYPGEFHPAVNHADYDLNIVQGTVILDEGNVPYARAELTCALPLEEVLEQIDPRVDHRVQITIEDESHPTDGSAVTLLIRTLDLILIARDVDFNSGTVTLNAWSDEGLLTTHALVSETPAGVTGLSVKTAVDHALAAIGATLAPGATDGTLENTDPEEQARNLIKNPSAELTADGWVAGSGTSAVVRSTASVTAYVGTACIRSTASASPSNFYIADVASIPALPGETFTASVYLRASVARSTTLYLRFYNSANGIISTFSGTAATATTTAWSRFTVTGIAPALTTSLAAYVSTSGSVSGNYIYADAAMLTKTSTALPYFDGTTAASGLTYYEWDGDPHASESVKLLQANSSTVWEPGTTAWEYVEPLVQATGLRLYADEHRVWHLEESGKTTEGLLTLGEGQNVTTAGDTISMAGDGEFFEGVVVEYRWTDALGEVQVKRDIAGVSGKALLVRYERPYPGPGAAASILQRAQGRGRVFNVSALSNYTATPGKAVAITLPSTPVQYGRIAAVEWAFPENTMTITSKGLTDTDAQAWLLEDEGDAWNETAVGIDWTEDL